MTRDHKNHKAMKHVARVGEQTVSDVTTGLLTMNMSDTRCYARNASLI